MNIFRRLWNWISSFWRKPVPLLPPYESLYPLTSTATESDEYTMHRHVFETTPEGEVRMTLQDSIFIYWSNKSISYKYLETVARKYVLVYDCKDAYVDMLKEMVHIVETPVVLKGPFATFRSSKRRPVHRWIKGKSNQYKHMGKWETVPEKIKPKSISFLDYKYNDE